MQSYGVITSTIPLHSTCSSSRKPFTCHARRHQFSAVQACFNGRKAADERGGRNGCHQITVAALAALASAVVSSGLVAKATPIDLRTQQRQQEEAETLANIPEELSSECDPGAPDCNKKARIQRPKSKQAETCTVKCVNTCIRGGYGSPGEGPFNIRRPIVVFKQGFRSRQYCLVECSDICNLIRDGDDGP